MTDVIVSELDSLVEVSTSSDSLKTASFSHLPKLEEFGLRYSGTIESIRLADTPELQLLWCDRNFQLTDLQFPVSTNLVRIEIDETALTEVVLPTLPSLKVLDCDCAALTNVVIDEAMNLEELECFGNAITSVDISANTNILLVRASAQGETCGHPTLGSIPAPVMPLDEIIVWWDTNSPPPINLQYDGNPVIRNP